MTTLHMEHFSSAHLLSIFYLHVSTSLLSIHRYSSLCKYLHVLLPCKCDVDKSHHFSQDLIEAVFMALDAMLWGVNLGVKGLVADKLTSILSRWLSISHDSII